MKQEPGTLNTYVVAERGIGRQGIGTLTVALGDIEHVAYGIGGKQGAEVGFVGDLGSGSEHRKHECEEHHE